MLARTLENERADGDLLTTGRKRSSRCVGLLWGDIGPGDGDLVIWLIRDLLFPDLSHGYLIERMHELKKIMIIK